MHNPLVKVFLAWAPLVLLFSPLATATPVYHDAALEAVSSRSLVVERDEGPSYHGALACGKFCTADRPDAAVLVNIMVNLNHELTRSDNCTTPARTCRRHACNNTSGVYVGFPQSPAQLSCRPRPHVYRHMLTSRAHVCNDNNYPLELSYSLDVGIVAGFILHNCCHRGFHKGTWGQQFVDELGYNVIIAYANCNHGVDDDAPGIGPPSDPWGPNGVCSQ